MRNRSSQTRRARHAGRVAPFRLAGIDLKPANASRVNECAKVSLRPKRVEFGKVRLRPGAEIGIVWLPKDCRAADAA